MAAAPAPRTWVDGEIPPVDTWNAELYETWKFLLNPPMVKARQTTAQSIASGGTWQSINFQTEDIDTHGAHSATVNPSRFTPKVPGYYVGYGGVSFVASAVANTHRRIMRFAVNGNPVNERSDSLAPSSPSTMNLVMKGVAFGPLYFNGTTDYIEVQVLQDSGSAINTDIGGGSTDYEECPEFYMRWWSK